LCTVPDPHSQIRWLDWLLRVKSQVLLLVLHVSDGLRSAVTKPACRSHDSVARPKRWRTAVARADLVVALEMADTEMFSPLRLLAFRRLANTKETSWQVP
jgi:hypothetical protein